MDADQRHTLMQEAATVAHCIDLALAGAKYHRQAVTQAEARIDTLEGRLLAIKDELAR